MNANDPSILTLDKTAFSIGTLSDTSDEKAYWLSRTPEERLQHMEELRRINYGDQICERLQRVFEVAQL